MKNTVISFILSISFAQISAQVTFSKDIAPIIYENCTSCHRPGEIAPFSLTNYEEVASWGNMISYVTNIKYMPPWKPDRDYSNFVGETGLTDEEIQLIADWVDAGLPQGNPNDEPPIPSFPSGSQLGVPDLVLEMEEDFFIEGNNQDNYRVFVLPSGLTEDQEIAAVEFRPGNNKAVHHALIAYEIEGAAAAKDAATDAYGYESFGDYGVPVQGTFTGYTPGIRTISFPEGIGTTIPAGADLLIQVHYAPLPSDETDRSSLNIFFKEDADVIERDVDRLPILPIHLEGGFAAFRIPPDEVTTFEGIRIVEEDISMITIYPHAHYLGKHWEIFALTPNADTIKIIRIEDWDFNWQGAYTFERMKKIPAGSEIHVIATYDNTTSNPFNPNSPPQMVSWGEGTADEMYLVGISYVPYQEGDEDIIIGDGLTSSINDVEIASKNRLFDPFPNPTSDRVVLSYYLDNSQEIDIELYDSKGALALSIVDKKRHIAGNHKLEFKTGGLSVGLYSVRMRAEGRVYTRSLVLTR